MTSENQTKEKPLRLALIGMSGAGRHSGPKEVSRKRRSGNSCDGRIEQKLAPRPRRRGFAGINGVAAWMGWPDSLTYGQRESDYLTEKFTPSTKVLTELEKAP